MPLRTRGTPPYQVGVRTFAREVGRLWPDVTGGFGGLGFGLPFLFGDGSDGDVTITGSTTIGNLQLKQYRNLTIASGGSLSTSGINEQVLLFCVKERLLVAGTITMDALGGIAGTDYTSSYGATGGGGGGGNSGAGTTGRSNAAGAGGAGGGIGLPGAVGVVLPDPYKTSFRIRQDAKDRCTQSYGTAGGAAGTGTTGAPGQGGKGGGGVVIFAEEIFVDSTGIITLDGGAGVVSTGAAGNSGGGGGGFLYIVTRRYTNNGSVAGTGGAAGTGGSGGAGGIGAAATIIIELIP